MPRKSGWINKTTRLAVWWRDDFTCVFCGKGAPDVRLSLDHLSEPDDHTASTLVTACVSCNSARKRSSVRSFCLARGWSPGTVWKRIRTQQAKPLAPYRHAVRTLRSLGAPAWFDMIKQGLTAKDMEIGDGDETNL